MNDPAEAEEASRLFERVSRYFALLGEPMRVRILHAVCHEERTVQQIVESTGASQTNVSRHLGLMWRAGALERRRDGAFVRYRVADQTLVELCRTVCVQIAARMEAEPVGRRHGLNHLIDDWTFAGGAPAPALADGPGRADAQTAREGRA